MRKYAKLSLLTLVAAAAMAFSAGAASAIDVSPAGSITAVGDNLAFNGEGGINVEVVCDVELFGSLAADVADTAGAHVGETTGGELEECSGGEVVMLFGSPATWEITYVGNNLPETPAQAVLTQNDAQFEVDVLGFNCLYKGDVDFILQDEEEGAGIRAQTLFVEEATVPKASGSFFCPPEGFLDGDFQLNAAQTLVL